MQLLKLPILMVLGAVEVGLLTLMLLTLVLLSGVASVYNWVERP